MPYFYKPFIFLAFIFVFAGNAISLSQPVKNDSLVATLPDTVVIQQLIVTGNHTTRLSIIMRELVFHEHDTLSNLVYERAVERTRENLMNTGLFNFVTIKQQLVPDRSLIVIIDLRERWYIFPVPIFELVDRNFNEWVKTGDFERINYGFFLNWDNFRGRNESVRFQFRWGYSQRIGIFYTIPYINKNQEEGLAFAATYSRNRETGYKVNNSKLLLYKNFNNFVRKEIYGGMRYSHRNGFYNTSSFYAEYRRNEISDTIVSLNPEFLGNGKNIQELITVSWLFRRDRRDYKVYPLKGYLADIEVLNNGTGLLNNEPNLLFITSQLKYFHKINSRWYASTSLRSKISGKSDAPFFNERGLGYGNEFVRGYEYYVIPGQHYVLSKNTIKFSLIPTRTLTLPFNFLEKFRTIPYAFYLNANFDAAFVHDRRAGTINPLANEWQYGYGVGIDYVSYYNLVFRIEYSFNKFGENGFFLHFTAPI
jgi:outer membrane protein assembly factor BamA